MALRCGGSTKGKVAGSPRFSEIICRMTSARLARWISGRVNSGRPMIILLGIEADADAGAGPAAASFALIAARPRDLADRQADGLGPGVIGGNPRQAGIDDIADAGNRDRGLGDIGGDDDLALAERLEDPFLVGRLQSAEDRQDHRLPELFGEQSSSRGGYPFRSAERRGYRPAPHAGGDR